MNRRGIIFKAQKELYFVLADNKEFKCKARGVFRDKNIRPLVGDFVDIQVLDHGEGYIEKIHQRKSQLIRPPVANIDQILLVLTLKSPNLNYNLVDKYLIMLEHFGVDVIMVFNKSDLVNEDDLNELRQIYSKTGYKLIFTSAINNIGMEQIKDSLRGKISALAGPSGVGKSSILNMISEKDNALTGSISVKNQRGRHTTRHTELFKVFEDSYILDTPGFSSIDLSFIESEQDTLEFFPEFRKYKDDCRFKNCQHINEPDCGVKSALASGDISQSRYKNYLLIREEIQKNRRY